MARDEARWALHGQWVRLMESTALIWQVDLVKASELGLKVS